MSNMDINDMIVEIKDKFDMSIKLHRDILSLLKKVQSGEYISKEELLSEEEIYKKIKDFQEIEWLVSNDPTETDEKIENRRKLFVKALSNKIKKVDKD